MARVGGCLKDRLISGFGRSPEKFLRGLKMNRSSEFQMLMIRSFCNCYHNFDGTGNKSQARPVV